MYLNIDGNDLSIIIISVAHRKSSQFKWKILEGTAKKKKAHKNMTAVDIDVVQVVLESRVGSQIPLL